MYSAVSTEYSQRGRWTRLRSSRRDAREVQLRHVCWGLRGRKNVLHAQLDKQKWRLWKAFVDIYLISTYFLSNVSLCTFLTHTYKVWGTKRYWTKLSRLLLASETGAHGEGGGEEQITAHFWIFTFPFVELCGICCWSIAVGIYVYVYAWTPGSAQTYVSVSKRTCVYIWLSIFRCPRAHATL